MNNINRPFWKRFIEEKWRKKSVIWLSGVRGAGKAYLCQSLENIEFFDCELPRVRLRLEDPESFLKNMKGCRVALDEIHRLNNPTELLKIAADYYPEVQIIATGSSTLGASSKFRETLTGRKERIWLTPLLEHESELFGFPHLEHRLQYGGLPPFFQQEVPPNLGFQEWLDSYWAKDIQELFHLEKRYSFLKLVEMVLAQSGSIFEASRFAAPCEIGRATVSNYLSVLEATHVAHVIRPYNTHRPSEIVSAPKVYGFDTGFVCYCKGWLSLNPENYGDLWEHMVLNEIQGGLQTKEVRYWRTKQDQEIDFVYEPQKGGSPIAIECKWRAGQFSPKAIKSFRKHYPEGKNIVVSSDIDTPFERHYEDLKVIFTGLGKLTELLK